MEPQTETIVDISPDLVPVQKWDEVVTVVDEALSNTSTGLSPIAKGISSPNFKSGSVGWRMNSNGDLEANSGTFRGALVGGSISIPNATTPTFSVDSFGNTVATSLRRKDFHWFTALESMDGYSKTAAGTGSFTLNQTGITSLTGTVSGNNNEIQKRIRNASTTAFSWDKNKSSKYCFLIQTDVNNHTMKIGNGDFQGAGTNRHIGFRVVNGAVSGSVANGTTESTVSLTSITNNFVYILEFFQNVTAGTVSFYINGTLHGTLSTNIPTGTSSSDYILNWHWQTDTAAAKEMELSWIDYWQAN